MWEGQGRIDAHVLPRAWPHSNLGHALGNTCASIRPCPSHIRKAARGESCGDAAQQAVAGDGGRVGRCWAGALGVRPPRLNRGVRPLRVALTVKYETEHDAVAGHESRNRELVTRIVAKGGSL